jgi:diguanylate cyclase (GGDEF)-like protein
MDLEARLQRARMVMFGSLGVAVTICIPWVGWWPLVLDVTQVSVYAALKPVIARSARPEYPIAFVVALAQVLIAAVVALTGGPDSPLLLVYLLGIAGLPARFGSNGVVAGVVLTEVLIFASTLGADPSGFAADPVPAVITAVSALGLAAFAHALMRAESDKRSESQFDALTGLPNRRGMEAGFEEQRAKARTAGQSLAFLLCDLDLFKSINDRHGHQRGDDVLRDAGDAIRRCLRPTEIVYRVGGEEFLVLLADCDLERALPVGERVRQAVESARPGGLSVTASVGVAAATGDEIDYDELFSEADRALYEAKRAGRNRVSLPPPLAA